MEYVVGVALFIAAVAVAFFVIRALARGTFGRSRRLERDFALEVLRGRLERGEISRAQFDEAVSAIGNG